MTLQNFFKEHPRAAVAFSGGVDSSYLLYAARACGAQVKAYYVKSAFQPQFELEDALRLANQVGAEMEVLPVDVLSCGEVAANPKNRCYFCKKTIFNRIQEKACRDGYRLILDGTNASDDASDRPGMRALQEMQVLSPLRLCGLRKDQIRKLSRQAGLFTWEKPAYACLATRIPTGETITAAKLERTERAEGILHRMGFRDFRVRSMGDVAKIQITPHDMEKIPKFYSRIVQELKEEYSAVLLDLEVRNEQ